MTAKVSVLGWRIGLVDALAGLALLGMACSEDSVARGRRGSRRAKAHLDFWTEPTRLRPVRLAFRVTLPRTGMVTDAVC